MSYKTTRMSYRKERDYILIAERRERNLLEELNQVREVTRKKTVQDVLYLIEREREKIDRITLSNEALNLMLIMSTRRLIDRDDRTESRRQRMHEVWRSLIKSSMRLYNIEQALRKLE